MATYAEKLKDPRWQKRRLEIFRRDGWKCVDCSDGGSNLQVDHAWYEPGLNPWDYPDEALHTRCERCHKAIGESRIVLGRVLAPVSGKHLRGFVEFLQACYPPRPAELQPTDAGGRDG